MRGVAAIGDVLDVNCWSNIPYYFYSEGERSGLFDTPWRLNLTKYRSLRVLWNAGQWLTFQGIGGFQYSSTFLTKAERSVDSSYYSHDVISLNQIFPRAEQVVRAGGKIYYYIDTPLSLLFKQETYGMMLSKEKKEAAIEQEKRNYRLATKVVAMGSWIKDELLDTYQVAPEKVTCILPGANVNSNLTVRNQDATFSVQNGKTFVLGFVGKDWKRKGLMELCSVASLLNERGLNVRVKIIGNSPDELINHPLVTYTGFIDKGYDSARFISELASCDLGCLFSTAEALGISTLEFLYAGIPVTGYFHQGLLDTLFKDASIRFSLGTKTEQIAEQLANYITDSEAQLSLRQAARRRAPEVTWERCIHEWSLLLHG